MLPLALLLVLALIAVSETKRPVFRTESTPGSTLPIIPRSPYELMHSKSSGIPVSLLFPDLQRTHPPPISAFALDGTNSQLQRTPTFQGSLSSNTDLPRLGVYNDVGLTRVPFGEPVPPSPRTSAEKPISVLEALGYGPDGMGAPPVEESPHKSINLVET